MKIFLFSKKKIIYSIFIIITLAILLFTFSNHNFQNPTVIKLTSNSAITNNFMDKIKASVKEGKKIAYITFDDGPTASVTPKILDILKEENVKATFFVIGKSVEAHGEIVKRAYEEGHYIANHGYNHNNSNLYKSKENFIEEVTKTDEAIGKALGIENYCSHIFRFPNGFMAPLYKSEKEEAISLLLSMDYVYIDWNCLNKDSEKKYSASQLLENLKNSSKGKNTLVVLMHDTKDVSDSSLILKDSISYLKSQGYEFENFYDLLE